MDYSKLSDFEINKLVAKTIGAVDVRQLKNMINEVYCKIDGKRSFKDFCNNPSDAWPIIVENKISIWSQGSSSDLFCAFWQSEENLKHTSDNPLRAAMIVYLMMQDELKGE